MNDEHRKMNEQVIEHYGIRAQAKYMMTEVYELIEAILEHTIRFHRDAETEKHYTSHVAEEIADVYVFLDQFCAWFGIKWDDVNRIAESKIERQTERIKKEGKL